jgi:hypothetical protein
MKGDIARYDGSKSTRASLCTSFTKNDYCPTKVITVLNLFEKCRKEFRNELKEIKSLKSNYNKIIIFWPSALLSFPLIFHK